MTSAQQARKPLQQCITREEMKEEHYLPYDYSRCNGVTKNGELHLTCVDCMRKLSPGRKEYQGYISGVILEDGKCSSKISVKQWKGS